MIGLLTLPTGLALFLVADIAKVTMKQTTMSRCHRRIGDESDPGHTD